jgi:hypothetical protein
MHRASPLGVHSLVRSSLLSIHLLCVIVWLGCGLYELFVSRDIRRSAGTEAEFHRLATWLRYQEVVPVATVLVAASGVLMSSLLGWGFFTSLWLGLKQALMLGILAGMALVGPRMVRLKRAFLALPEGVTRVPPEIRATFFGAEPWFVAMRVAGLASVLLAGWRPVA